MKKEKQLTTDNMDMKKYWFPHPCHLCNPWLKFYVYETE